MNIAHLRSFVAVVEHGSFSAAARTLHLSQPAVTMQIQSLEADIGATLLDRQYRRIELTEAGRLLLPVAEGILQDVEKVRDAIAELSDTVTGRLTLAASTTPGQYVLPRIVGSFLKHNPDVGVSIAVMDTAQVVDAVEAGEASLGMTGAKLKGTKVTYERLGHDDLFLICPPDHAFASRPPDSLEEVVEQPFVMREDGSGTRIVTEETLRGAGVDPGDLHVVTELGTGEAIVSAVEGGMGVSVVSHWLVDKAIELGTVAKVDCEYFPVHRPLYVVLPRGTLTRAADAFLDHLRDELGEPGEGD
jgi:DNA-binding transcriptional LysR family regulator